LLVGTAFAIIRLRDLYAVIMLLGIYGLLTASFFVLMDAVDVAITEAAVGAGISTLLLLVTVTITERKEHRRRHRKFFGAIVTLLCGGLLIYGTSDMPKFGAVDSPAQVHVAPHFLNESMQEVGVVNIVTVVLASYRAYDTLGETVVIFTAGMAVLILLSLGHSKLPSKLAIQKINRAMHDQNLILRIVVKMLLPFILLFAFYIQFHGDFGPGGGFQAGVIFAAGIIVYTLLFGLETARRVINQRVVLFIAAAGMLLYGGTGVWSLFFDKNFLDYSALSKNALDGQHLGILLVEFGIGLTVTSVMVIIYFNFAGRHGHVDEENVDEERNE